MNNLGNILKERNELIEAEQLLSKAVSIQYVAKFTDNQFISLALNIFRVLTGAGNH